MTWNQYFDVVNETDEVDDPSAHIHRKRRIREAERVIQQLNDQTQTSIDAFASNFTNVQTRLRANVQELPKLQINIDIPKFYPCNVHSKNPHAICRVDRSWVVLDTPVQKKRKQLVVRQTDYLYQPGKKKRFICVAPPRQHKDELFSSIAK